MSGSPLGEMISKMPASISTNREQAGGNGGLFGVNTPEMNLFRMFQMMQQNPQMQGAARFGGMMPRPSFTPVQQTQLPSPPSSITTPAAAIPQNSAPLPPPELPTAKTFKGGRWYDAWGNPVN